MENIERFEVDGVTVRIVQDPEPMNPRKEFDHMGTMYCWHRRYELGDEHSLEVREGQEFATQVLKTGGIVLPLFLMDHSGITMRTSSALFRACDSAGWDWGQVGFIFVEAKKIREEYSVKRITKKTREKAEKCLEAEVEEYDNYLTGNVYGYVIEDPDGNHLDSCWGFFGDIKDVKEEATITAKSEAKDYFAKKREEERKYGEKHNG
jgi:hypothetical protein